jgi:hypothetical protein
MDAVDISRVCALASSARELGEQGRAGRALQKYKDAYAAAQQLRQPDCMVMTLLHLSQAHYLGRLASAPDLLPAEAAVMRHDSSALLCAAMATLQRRKAARTLLPGACRAHEEAFYREYLTPKDDGAAAQAPFIGYNAYLTAAKQALSCMVSPSWLQTHEQRCTYVAFVCDAVDILLAQPRGATNITAMSEAILVAGMQHCANGGRLANYVTEPWTQLHAAWVRLQQSGMLLERGIAECFDRISCEGAKQAAAENAAAAASPLRMCALASCAALELRTKRHKLCSACRGVVYCCKSHQQAEWRAHKAACRAAVRAAAPDAAA